jgi:MFS transporter, DHA1 family, inner membrane transport protein
MANTNSKNSFDTAPIIISALAISAIGALFYNVLPLYLGSAQDFRDLNNREIGFISSAFFLGYIAVTVWAFFWIRRWSWRIVTWVALPIALLGLLAGAWAQSYLMLLLSTVVAGGGFAAIYGIGTTILADTSNPARWYGVKIAAEAFPGAILLFVLPLTLIPDHGFPGAAYGLIIAALLLAPLLLMLPAQGLKERETSTEAQMQEEFANIDRRPVWGALFATFIFFSAASGMWAFIERMGSHLGFAAEAIGTLLSITLLFATGGSLLTAWLGERFGNVRPFYLSCLAMMLALALLAMAAGFELYAVATCILTFAIGMGIPFAVAEIAELDADGRFIILSVPAIGMGAMVGPGLAGVLADTGSFVPVLVAAAAALVLAMLLMRYSDGFRGPLK